MTCCCPQCSNIFKGEDFTPCPYCGWQGNWREPRTMMDLDQIGEDVTRERFHHKIDTEVH